MNRYYIIESMNDIFTLNSQKKKGKCKMKNADKKKRYFEFQHTLDYFFCEHEGIDEEDYFKFGEVKSGIIFFMCKNKFHE